MSPASALPQIRVMKTALRLLPLVLTATALAAEPLPAFPGADGAGLGATGGRGGSVVRVTNLHADGPGSFADAVSAGNRIVVFDVSGVIDLTQGKEGTEKGGSIVIKHPNITVAGQTAPGEGICLKGGSLTISASNVIVRHVRSRRGWIRTGDMGDAIEIKPVAIGVQTDPAGRSAVDFEKIQRKKEERGKQVSKFADLTDIYIDHCSTSWATDENLTVTHAGRTTVSWSIAAEGCDYANPRQTPPNHSEGSLWGSSAPDGRSTMHHMLYAHNRLRNPRTVGGDEVPPVLTFFNNVVYNWSEHPTHTGSQRVHLQWLHSYYKPGPNTPSEVRGTGFEFHGDPLARVYAEGIVMDGTPAATADNRRAVGYDGQKFKKATAADKAAMIVDRPWTALPARMQTAAEAYESVLADAGATLPARDAVDLRIMRGVRAGTGRVIEKETDHPVNDRWPNYRALPSPKDSDADGIPDFWEQQFGLDPKDATDSAKIAGDGYANIEHYFNSTDPRGGSEPVVFIAATVSRARPHDPGEWRITRTGDSTLPLNVPYTVGGDAQPGKDFAALPGSVTIPAGQTSATIPLAALPESRDQAVVVLSLATGAPNRVGCPAQSLIVILR